MRNKLTVTDFTQIALFTAIICILVQFSVPLPGGVPMTLQTLIIPLAGLILGAKKGTYATLLYILLGVVGLPVFAGGKAGIGVLLSVTGGFIVSFPLMPLLAGVFENFGYKLNNKRSGMKYYTMLMIGLVLGAFINYFIGTVWFVIMAKSTVEAALMACVIPFIPTAIIKIIIDFILAPILKTALVRAGILATQ